MKEYFIPAGYGEIEHVEKKSRFISRVWRVDSEEEAQAHLQTIRAKHRDANHNVWTYRIRETGVERYSDDGEPQGTSGLPTLYVFSKEEINNVLCATTRYFGGTLLGAGGLVRAYSQSAKLALDAAGVSVVRLWQRILMECSYGQYERLSKMANENGATIENTDFAAQVTLRLLVPHDNVDQFLAHMTEASAGTAQLSCVDTEELAVRIR